MSETRFRHHPPRLRTTGSRSRSHWSIGLALGLMLLISSPAAAYTGRVLDSSTSAPIPGAIVTLGNHVARTNAAGQFQITGPGDTVGFRAYGYLRSFASVASFQAGSYDVRLTPFRPKGLYLSFFGIGSRKLRDDALVAMKQRGLNAVVMDVKGDRGLIPYKTSIALARQIRAGRLTTVWDPKELVDSLHRNHLYVIARIVVFKDDCLAAAKPALAIRRPGGALYRDREDLAWVDPFRKQVWNYDIAIAVEAARLGVDEIQFDYVRFPDITGLVFSKPNTMDNRLAAITGFLTEARRQLAPYNVFLSADIFGYVMWNRNDTDIGQRLEELSRVVDYLSPMLYPSGFQYGIPGYRDPVAHPYDIVSRSLQKGGERADLSPLRFRPWLQSFRDYAFDHRPFGDAEINAQTRAADQFGADGWLLWNPRNLYFQFATDTRRSASPPPRSPARLLHAPSGHGSASLVQRRPAVPVVFRARPPRPSSAHHDHESDGFRRRSPA